MSHPERAETMVRVYKKPDDFHKDAVKLAKDGWGVAHMMERRPRQGCARVVLMGFLFAFLFPPKPEIVVTYERAVLAKGYVRCYSCGTINRVVGKRFSCVKCGVELSK